MRRNFAKSRWLRVKNRRQAGSAAPARALPAEDTRKYRLQSGVSFSPASESLRMQDRGHLLDVLGGLTFGLHGFVLNSSLQFSQQPFLELTEMVHLVLQQGVAFQRPLLVERSARRLRDQHSIR